MRRSKTKRRAAKKPTKPKQRKTNRKKALLAAAKVLQEIQAGPFPDGELSPGAEWLQQEQEAWERRNPNNTPAQKAKWLRAVEKLGQSKGLFLKPAQKPK